MTLGGCVVWHCDFCVMARLRKSSSSLFWDVSHSAKQTSSFRCACTHVLSPDGLYKTWWWSILSQLQPAPCVGIALLFTCCTFLVFGVSKSSYWMLIYGLAGCNWTCYPWSSLRTAASPSSTHRRDRARHVHRLHPGIRPVLHIASAVLVFTIRFG